MIDKILAFIGLTNPTLDERFIVLVFSCIIFTIFTTVSLEVLAMPLKVIFKKILDK